MYTSKTDGGASTSLTVGCTVHGCMVHGMLC